MMIILAIIYLLSIFGTLTYLKPIAISTYIVSFIPLFNTLVSIAWIYEIYIYNRIKNRLK